MSLRTEGVKALLLRPRGGFAGVELEKYEYMKQDININNYKPKGFVGGMVVKSLFSTKRRDEDIVCCLLLDS